jgi:2-dehydropantoate 2-reductase
MRFVILGAGAIGGVIGARLHQAGFDVTLIARGPHFESIRQDGLTLQTPVERVVLELPVFDEPRAIDWEEDHVVLLAIKSQDTAPALAALSASAPTSLPIVCMQNGVENERLALRRFGDVYGAVVMLPAAHLEPGVVQAYGTALTGIIDLGRYPGGVDARAEAIAAALRGASFHSQTRPDVMRFKYAKLIVNLANAVDALCGPGARSDALVAVVREEGRAALRAAGIEFDADDVDDVRGRWERMQVRAIDGQERAGSSTWQSLARGARALETDYLNGEITLLGRLHGVGTPVNDTLCALAGQLARDGGAPGQLSPEEVFAHARSPSATHATAGPGSARSASR